MQRARSTNLAELNSFLIFVSFAFSSADCDYHHYGFLMSEALSPVTTFPLSFFVRPVED
jgi:hypothetical protein